MGKKQKTAADFAEDEARTTPLGLFNTATAFREAAEGLESLSLKSVMRHMPVRFLYFHAIELYLKSFLRTQSYTVTEVRGFGHDFRKLAKLALKSGFEFSATDIEVIMALGDSDAVIEARYLRTGAKIGSLPIETIRGTCKRLHEAIGKQLSEKGVLVRR